MNHSPNHRKIKICLMTISLAGGGAERSTAHLSKMLSDKGYEVHIVSIVNNIEYEYAGTLFTLGNVKKKWGLLSNFFRLNKLRNYLKTEAFDFIIDNRTRSSLLKERIYNRFIYRNNKLIFVIRSSNLPYYFPDNKEFVLNQSKKVVKYIGVSKAITSMISQQYGFTNCISIYNPIPLSTILKQSNTELESLKNKEYIIALGRLDEPVKNYSLLLEAYNESKLSENNIHLLILGDGPDKELLFRKIKELDLSNFVSLKPFESNPFPWLKQAKFTVLTSKFEGFPRVLIESLAVGTPVLSVDCVSGPSEIIQDKINGLLVENNNSKLLAKGMDNLIFDEGLYRTCKQNAIKSVAHLDTSIIAEQWDKMLQDEYY